MDDMRVREGEEIVIKLLVVLVLELLQQQHHPSALIFSYRIKTKDGGAGFSEPEGILDAK